ncbi:Hypothetical predicted protein [Paramuricea clavata]|uniref:Uncharacterized protein n=1 Tax=Paramuricea clavata TaxID=317549 RepID=A0A7D9IX81_PARCT|nr:Hypothetical predicted protein [Paramuricea clavata]
MLKFPCLSEIIVRGLSGPEKLIVGGEDDPYGQRSLLGWGVIGNVCKSSEKDDVIQDGYCNKTVVTSYPNFAFATKAKEIIQPQKVLEVLESDFIERQMDRKAYSVEDARFMQILEKGIKQLPDGHYEMSLPLKSDRIVLPNNRTWAVKRWQQLLMRDVLKAFPIEERAKCFKDLDLQVDDLPIEQALGIRWCVENDSLQFRIELQDHPVTRRGILSTVGSIYDPNGYLAPITLKGKQILQQMCRDRLDWDDPVPHNLSAQWEKWRLKSTELHHFSDASLEGYGQCSYIRLINEDKVHCSFVVGKARVTALKQVTIPRLELTAATISARMSKFLRNELSYQEIKEYFWTDSKIVLGYISNVAKRFHTYVANRIQEIRDATDPLSWNYVDTNDNPADGSRWLKGPSFLWKCGTFESQIIEKFVVNDNDPEAKKAVVSKVYSHESSKQDWDADRLNHVSNWYRAQKIIALCLRLKVRVRRKEVKKPNLSNSLNERPLFRLTVSLPELQEAEKEILRAIQRKYFGEEIQVLKCLKVRETDVSRNVARKRNEEIKRYSLLYRLDPFLDDDGLVRVGGCIKRANFPVTITHPVVIPRKSRITNLLIYDCHVKVNHMGRGITHNELEELLPFLIC